MLFFKIYDIVKERTLQCVCIRINWRCALLLAALYGDAKTKILRLSIGKQKREHTQCLEVN